MDDNLNIPIILGTARQGCSTVDAFAFVQNYLNDSVATASFPAVRVGDYLLGRTYEAWNEHPEVPEIAEWQEIAQAADGFIFVVPEYNHSYPGELKILLDAAFEEYFDKPVMLVGVSGGSFGGSRVVEHIKPTLIELGMKPTGHAVYFSDVGTAFDDAGDPTAETADAYEERLDEAVLPLVTYARQLQEVREEDQ